ncbi:hypothetical protein BZG02_19730 [Labilibaculum filiforme]|uniref:SCP domain-containing protein n=1 Tax=Labilibaculum filiforme TaxID=1940526 RepID=A0A2N3HQL4_9BACT|nr:CAP domain-containing protein [Labilibaculum filiforme]PKQ60342.1 hypothetical protein BZG02_19730 [Labilibaculum filiforme]
MSKTFYFACLLFIGIFGSCSQNDIDFDDNIDTNFDDPIDTNNIDIQKLLDMVNEVRASGTTCETTYYPPVGAVTWNSTLEAAALKHSKDMKDNDFFSHTSFNGDKFVDRLNAAGYNYNNAGENIALGYSTEENVINAWLTSQGHCANIMNPNFTEMGVGRIENYWTQDFGKPKE